MKNRKIPIIIASSLLAVVLSAGIIFAQAIDQTAQPQVVEYKGAKDAFGKNLIVVFSLTGNTLKLAKIIQLKTGGSIFEIKTKTTYPTGDELIPFAKAQRDQKETVEFEEPLPDLAEYDTIFLGTPVWFHEVPYPLSVFLAECDFKGMPVIPFITSGGGPGDVVASLRGSIKDADIKEALLISRYTTRPIQEIENYVNSWLNPLAAAREAKAE